MGHRAYLIKTAGKSSEVLFESNNTIPLFWFGLLDSASVKTIKNDLIQSYNNADEEEPAEYPNITLSKNSFIANLNAGKTFIENNYADKSNLYNDFIHYLDTTFSENDVLELDIFEMANFDSMENLIESLLHIIHNIGSNVNKFYEFEPNKSIYSLVGYDGFFVDEFKKYSKDYFNYLIKEGKEKISYKNNIEKQEAKEKRKELLENIGMIAFGIVCIVGSVFGILKSGNVLMGIVGILFGLTSLLFGIIKNKK